MPDCAPAASTIPQQAATSGSQLPAAQHTARTFCPSLPFRSSAFCTSADGRITSLDSCRHAGGGSTLCLYPCTSPHVPRHAIQARYSCIKARPTGRSSASRAVQSRAGHSMSLRSRKQDRAQHHGRAGHGATCLEALGRALICQEAILPKLDWGPHVAAALRVDIVEVEGLCSVAGRSKWHRRQSIRWRGGSTAGRHGGWVEGSRQTCRLSDSLSDTCPACPAWPHLTRALTTCLPPPAHQRCGPWAPQRAGGC